MHANGDWIKLHRRIGESAVFRNSSLVHLWVYLLINANYGRRQLEDGTILEPGQLIRGYRRIADDLRWGVSKVQRWMGRLRVLGNVKTDTRNGTLAQVITICNWESYQAAESNGDTLSDTQAGTLPGTLPGTKRRKKEREEVKKHFVIPTLGEVQTYCLERQNGIDAQHFVDYYERQDWRLANGRKMSNWQAGVRTWEAKRKQAPKESQPTAKPMTAEQVNYYNAHGGSLEGYPDGR